MTKLLSRVRQPRQVWSLALLLFSASLILAQGEHEAEEVLGIRMVAFSPDGKTLASCSGEPKQKGELVLWDLKTHKPIFVHRESVGIPSVAFAPDGKTLAIGTFSESAKLFEASSGKVLAVFPGHGKSARGVAFSPDGQTLAVSSYDHTIRLWDLASRKVQRKLEEHSDWVYCVAFSPDGKLLASSSSDRTVKVWNLATSKVLHTLEHGSIVRSVMFSPGGRWVLSASWDGYVPIRDAKTGKFRAYLQNGSADDVDVSPNMRFLAVARDSTAQLCDLTLRDPAPEEKAAIRGWIAKLDDDSYQVRDEAHRRLADFGFLGEPLLRPLLKSKSVEVRLRARRLRQQIFSPTPRATFKGHSGRVESVAVSPDGQILATGGEDGLVKLWNVTTGDEIAAFRPPQPTK